MRQEQREVAEAVVSYFQSNLGKPFAIERFGLRSNACRYRLEFPDGYVAKCAVGCLIPDEAYDHQMENSTVADLIGCNDTIDEIVDKAGIDLLTTLQDQHDSWARYHEVIDQHYIDDLRNTIEMYEFDHRSA